MKASLSQAVSSHPWVRAVIVSVVAVLAIVTVGQAAVTLNANMHTDGTLTSVGLITGSAGATVTGGAVNLNATSNFATNINTGTSTGALTLGGGSGTVAINSSDWDITSGGLMTGISSITTDGDIILSDDAGNLRHSVQDNLNAQADATQANATQITADITEVQNVVGANDSVKLQSADAVGLQAVVINRGANSLDLYPATGDQINGAGLNVPKTVAAGASVMCFSLDISNWECLTLAR